MTAPASWPELGEELARKGMTVLQDRFFAYTEGKLSRREIYLVLDTIHSMMHGLAPDEASEEIYDMRQKIKKGEV